MVLLGTLTMALVFSGVSLAGRHFFVHTLIGGSLLVIIGSQVLALGLCGRAYGVLHLGERDARFERAAARLRLEHGLLLGGIVTLAGVGVGAAIVARWADNGFGTLGEERLAILAATFVIVGIQIFFTSFLLSIMGLRRRAG
jgi:hypothetical protein